MSVFPFQLRRYATMWSVIQYEYEFIRICFSGSALSFYEQSSRPIGMCRSTTHRVTSCPSYVTICIADRLTQYDSVESCLNSRLVNDKAISKKARLSSSGACLPSLDHILGLRAHCSVSNY